MDTSAAIRMTQDNVSLLDTASAGPLAPPNFNAPIVINAGPGEPAMHTCPDLQGNLSLHDVMHDVTVWYSADLSANPSTP